MRLKILLESSNRAKAVIFDPADPYYISLFEEFKLLFEKCNLSEQTQDEMHNMKKFESLYKRIKELNKCKRKSSG